MDGHARGKDPVEQSLFPAKLAALMASVAENLELHMKALDLKAKNARKGYKAYARLAKEHRDISSSLQAIARELEGYGGVVMRKPGEDVLSDPNIQAAFGKFMKAEKELIALLQKRMRRDPKILKPRRPKDHDEGKP